MEGGSCSGRRRSASSRPPGKAILTRIQVIALRVAAAKVTGQGWNEESITRVTGVRPSAANIAVLHSENLSDPTRKPTTPIIVCRPSEVVDGASLLRHRRWANGDRLGLFAKPHVIKPRIEALLRLRYVLAIRSGAYEAPQLLGLNFAAGRYIADAFLFDVKDGRLLGGVEIGARNTPIVESTGQITVETLISDLASNARYVLKHQLADRLPSIARDERFCPW